MNQRSFRQLLVPDEPVADRDGLLRAVEEVLRQSRSDDLFVSNIIPAVAWQQVDADGRAVRHDPKPDGRAPALPNRPRPLGSIITRVTGKGTDFLEPYRVLTSHLADVRTPVQSDPGLGGAFWAGVEPFGTRAQARCAVGVPDAPPPGKHRVYVVIVDQGFDKRRIPAANYGGGFDATGGATPGSRPAPGMGRSRHAAAIARTVIDIAPHAVLHDAPLIPATPPGALPNIGDLTAFSLDAVSLWFELGAAAAAGWGRESWVIVNAWSLYDRRLDHGPVHYATDPNHVLNLLVDDLVRILHVDTVFAAGNCGQFAPDLRCGPNDRGPCRSILGANSLRSVLTAGATRTDETWFGYASQGPGQPKLGLAKPDLSAPSGFAEVHDADLALSGTSGAAAMAGGVVAALRSHFGQVQVPPAGLNKALRTTAHKTGQPASRVGQGTIRLDAALQNLSASQHP